MRTCSAILGSLILLFATGCSIHQVPQSRNQEIASHVPDIAPKLEEQLPKRTCTTVEDARASIAECQKLIDDARHILWTVNTWKVATKNEELIDYWREKEKVWKAHNDDLTSGCELLLGADGTRVYHQIPLTLKTLNRADEWLAKSMSIAMIGNRKKALFYVRRARAASARATMLLDGKPKANLRAAFGDNRPEFVLY